MKPLRNIFWAAPFKQIDVKINEKYLEKLDDFSIFFEDTIDSEDSFYENWFMLLKEKNNK